MRLCWPVCARARTSVRQQRSGWQEGASSDEGEAMGARATLQAEEGSLADPDNDEQYDDEGASPKAAHAAELRGASLA